MGLAGQRVVRVGHRGAAGHAPENTLAAVRAGIALGVNFVEVDVQQSRDGRLLVMHDAWVDRTTDGTGAVCELTWEELQRLDAGGGERVPSLEDVLTAANGRAGVMLEVKASAIGPEIWRAVKAAEFAGEVVYASFLHAEVLAIRRLDAGARTMVLMECVPVSGAALALEARAGMVGLAVDSVGKEFVADLHAAGLEVWVYTVNDARGLEAVVRAGVDGVITNFPELLG